MENQPLEQTNITITEVISNKPYGVKIKDEKGLIYNVNQFLKDKPTEETKAWQTLMSLPADEVGIKGIGCKRCFKFVSVANNQGGNSRYVRIIGNPELSGDIANTSSPTPITPPEQPQGFSGQSHDKAVDWDKISWGKCKHAYLVEAFKLFYKGELDPALGLEKIEKDAEEWANMSMRKLSETTDQAIDEGEPLPNIPF